MPSVVTRDTNGTNHVLRRAARRETIVAAAIPRVAQRGYRAGRIHGDGTAHGVNRTARQTLARDGPALRPDGALGLGGAETTVHLGDAFERVQIGRAPVYRLRDGKA